MAKANGLLSVMGAAALAGCVTLDDGKVTVDFSALSGKDAKTQEISVDQAVQELWDADVGTVPQEKVAELARQIIPSYQGGKIGGNGKAKVDAAIDRYLNARNPYVALNVLVESSSPLVRSQLADKTDKGYRINVGGTSWYNEGGRKKPIVNSTQYSNLKGTQFTTIQKLEMVSEGKPYGFVMGKGAANWTWGTQEQGISFLQEAGYMKKVGDGFKDLKLLHPIRGIGPSRLYDGDKANGEIGGTLFSLYNLNGNKKSK